MSNIFTHQFMFLNNTYRLLVSVGNSGPQPYIHIQFLQPSKNRIPETHIRYTGFKGYKNLLSYANDPLWAATIERAAREIEWKFFSSEAIIKPLYGNIYYAP